MPPAVPQAAAAGGAQADGLVAATAVAICQGGATAAAYSEAYAVAVSKNPEGCTVLTEAYTRASVQCGPQGASAFAKSSTTVTVLNDCASKNRPIFVPVLVTNGGGGGGGAAQGTTPAPPSQPVGFLLNFPPIQFKPIDVPGFQPVQTIDFQRILDDLNG